MGSKQIQEIRMALRSVDSVLLMGKNTLIKRGIKHRITEPKEDDEDYLVRKDNFHEYPEISEIIPLCKNNVGFVFCKGNLNEVKEVLLQNRKPAPARQGVFAPNNVTIPAGPTGLDPSMTGFFQVLQIATKIAKGQIEILSNVELIREGDKVTASHVQLLTKLGIKPFSYGLELGDV